MRGRDGRVVAGAHANTSRCERVEVYLTRLRQYRGVDVAALAQLRALALQVVVAQLEAKARLRTVACVVVDVLDRAPGDLDGFRGKVEVLRDVTTIRRDDEARRQRRVNAEVVALNCLFQRGFVDGKWVPPPD